MIAERLGDYFDKLNETTYMDKGMEWFMIPGHYWLELRIHKRRNNFVDDNVVYTTNVETTENRTPGDGKGKADHKEELKTEEPLHKDESGERQLAQMLKNSDED